MKLDFGSTCLEAQRTRQISGAAIQDFGPGGPETFSIALAFFYLGCLVLLRKPNLQTSGSWRRVLRIHKVQFGVHKSVGVFGVPFELPLNPFYTALY